MSVLVQKIRIVSIHEDVEWITAILAWLNIANFYDILKPASDFTVNISQCALVRNIPDTVHSFLQQICCKIR